MVWSIMLQAMRALSAWGATLYGCVAILALTPLAAYAALALPLAPRELAVGLAVFCCMPTTLSSGVSLTQVRYCLPFKFGRHMDRPGQSTPNRSAQRAFAALPSFMQGT